MGAGPGWPLGWIIGGMRSVLGGDRRSIILPSRLHWRLPHSERASNNAEIGKQLHPNYHRFDRLWHL